MELVRVSLEDLSDIRYEVALAPHPQFTQPEFLHVTFCGVYRSGSSGKPDAKYIMAVMAALDRAWFPDAFIVDLTELTYIWGDEMTWIWDIGTICSSDCHRPLAVIAGSKSRDALRSLDPDEFEMYCVDTFSDALDSIRRQKPVYDACMEKFWASNRPT